jgi:hypothetical protein
MLGEFSSRKDFFSINIANSIKRTQTKEGVILKEVNPNEVKIFVEKIMQQVNVFKLSGY